MYESLKKKKGEIFNKIKTKQKESVSIPLTMDSAT